MKANIEVEIFDDPERCENDDMDHCNFLGTDRNYDFYNYCCLFDKYLKEKNLDFYKCDECKDYIKKEGRE